MTDQDVQFMVLVAVVLAGCIILGLLIDWWRRHPITPRRDHVMHGVQRRRMSIAETRRWEKRLSMLHVVDPGHGERVRIVAKGPT